MKRIAALALLILAAVPARARPEVTIRTQHRQYTGHTRWSPKRNVYVLISRGRDYHILASQVVSLSVARPDDLDRAIELMSEQAYEEAIPLLETIARRYTMLEWDLEAYRLLVRCHQQMNAPEKLTDVYRRASTSTRTGADADLTMAYLQALLDCGEVERTQTEADALLSEADRARFEIMLERQRSPAEESLSPEPPPGAPPSEQ